MTVYRLTEEQEMKLHAIANKTQIHHTILLTRMLHLELDWMYEESKTPLGLSEVLDILDLDEHRAAAVPSLP